MNLRRLSTTQIATFLLTICLLAGALHRWRLYNIRQQRQHGGPIKVHNKGAPQKNLLAKPVEPHTYVDAAAKSKTFEYMKHNVDNDAKRKAANKDETIHAANPDAMPNPDVNKAKDDRKPDWNNVKDDRKPDWNRVKDDRKPDWNNVKDDRKPDWNNVKDDRKPDWNNVKDDRKPDWNRVKDDRKPDLKNVKDDRKPDWNRVKDDRKPDLKNVKDDRKPEPVKIAEQEETKKLTAARTPPRNEEHLNTSSNRSLLLVEQIVKLAKQCARLNKNTVILGFIDEDSLPFVKNWLCNTYQIVSHESVLFVTTTETSKDLLKKHWPNANVVVMDISKKDKIREYKTTVTDRKLRTISTILQAGINVLLFDVHSVWFKNPVKELNADAGSEFDIAVNLASKSHIHVNVGLIYLVAKAPTRAVWERLLFIYRTLNQAESAWLPMLSKDLTYMDKYYETYLQHMVESRYEGITAKVLPLTSYTDDTWHMLPEAERDRTSLVVMKYNLLQGTEETITRVKQWNHWFLNSDGECNEDLVRKAISKPKHL